MANKTVTVKSAGGDYTSLNAALAGESANLVTGTCILTIECYSMEDTTAASTGTGYTTSLLYYINITVPSAERHSGKWNEAKYHMNVDKAFCLSITEDYAVVEGLQFIVTTDTSVGAGGIKIGTGSGGIFTDGSNQLTIRKCIIRGGTNSGGTGNEFSGIWIYDGGVNVKVNVYNSIIYDFHLDAYLTVPGVTWAGIHSQYGNTIKLYNVTTVDNSYGICANYNFGTLTLRNCLSDRLNSSLIDFGITAITPTVTYCASSDATADDWGGDGNHISHTFTFADEANDDYHLGSTDTGAIDLGISDVDSLFSDDIDGETRTGTWDIGADEYVATGGTTYPSPDIFKVLSASKSGMGNIDNIFTWSIKKHEF